MKRLPGESHYTIGLKLYFPKHAFRLIMSDKRKAIYGSN